VNVHELAPGFSFWLAPHPEWDPSENWPEEVLCVRYDTADAIVLIDPLLPRREEAGFWQALDADIERLGRPISILLTSPWHARDASAVADRYSASVWAPPRARWKGPSLTSTEDPPSGVEALHPDGDEDQALFFIPEHRTLVTGDVFSGTEGRFHVFLDEQDPDAFLAWLGRLAELPIDRVLIAHGEPVLSDGAARVREAVAEARALYA
jgi:glyoxylase-like metal-dependent hydrolase (beta-lactamase superfamily II)